MSNVGNATHAAGAYDKLLFKLYDPEFPLRLLPPYQGATELMFQRFRAAMPEEWFACESLLVESVTGSPESLFSG